MDFLKYAISKPVTVAVGSILILLFGVIGLIRLPVQLAPDTELPQIEVYTMWPGATPSEIESEIVEKQEDKFKSLRNLQTMESSSYNDLARITLTFGLETDINTAVLRVSNKLDEVWDYPDNVKNPIINTSGANAKPMIILQLKMREGDPAEVMKYQTYFENEIRQYIERIEGIASLLVFGGTEDQLEIVLDHGKMARFGVTINDVIARVVAANKDTAAGLLGIDRKNYRIRTSAKFQDTKDPLDVVVYEDGARRIRLRDIADTRIGYAAQFVSILDEGAESIVIIIRREGGANVLEVVERLRAEVERLNREVLPEKNLMIKWSHDESPYILKAINIVRNNVFIGSILAISVLLLFLRSLRSTLVTAIAIPVSAMGAFVFLWLFNRNLNVVSLAGISFAIGMLVDNSIVVLENIDRHRNMGKRIARAAYEGAKEVYGAVVASTLTTVAVFLPVIFMREEAGQLFKDIAIAVTSSIFLSLLVSVTLIPSGMNFLYSGSKRKKAAGKSLINSIGSFFSKLIMKLSALFQKNVLTRILCILGFTSFSIFTAWYLMPKAEYLPQGNQNIIMNVLVPPPGYSADKRKEIGRYIYEQVKPHIDEDGRDGIPQLKNVFYVSSDMFSFVGMTCIEEHETEARKLIPLMNKVIRTIPDMLGVSIQPGIFETQIGRGRTVEVNVSGENLDTIVQSARMLFGALQQSIPQAQIRPVPSLELAYPECNIVPDKRKLAASGLNETNLGVYVDGLMNGRTIDEFRPDGGYQIDLVVRGDEKAFKTPEDILNCSIVNNFGKLVRIGDVARIEYTMGMTQIDRLEKRRNVRLEVTPPDDLPLQAAMEIIDGVVGGLKQEGRLANVMVGVGGSADKLVQTRMALQWNFLLALIIVYLLMSSLFENFLYPFIILFSIPLAAAGGFIGLWLINRLITSQPLDVLTMLGFVILIGTVVNNAILIVHQSLNNVRYEGMEGMQAIRESVRTRIRPIFMSASTSLFALIPLVLSTGSGSEMYRGIGSVLLGGLMLSSVFTLFVIPALLAFFIGFETRKKEAEEDGGEG
ncbi:MAG TPA: efflux RND transporter permease subunit [Desulfobacteraceae bacterium]|nr:efflux RND transporter permease subunit [Desulfobacteraceae bacterium]